MTTIGDSWRQAFAAWEGAAPVAVIGDIEMVLTQEQAAVLADLLDAGEAGIPGGPRGQVIRVANALGLVVETVMGEPGERLRYRLVGPVVRLVCGTAVACKRNSEHDCPL